MLERLVRKLTRAVLRREGVSNHSDLSDINDVYSDFINNFHYENMGKISQIQTKM